MVLAQGLSVKQLAGATSSEDLTGMAPRGLTPTAVGRRPQFLTM